MSWLEMSLSLALAVLSWRYFRIRREYRELREERLRIQVVRSVERHERERNTMHGPVGEMV